MGIFRSRESFGLEKKNHFVPEVGSLLDLEKKRPASEVGSLLDLEKKTLDSRSRESFCVVEKEKKVLQILEQRLNLRRS